MVYDDSSEYQEEWREEVVVKRWGAAARHSLIRIVIGDSEKQKNEQLMLKPNDQGQDDGGVVQFIRLSITARKTRSPKLAAARSNLVL